MREGENVDCDEIVYVQLCGSNLQCRLVPLTFLLLLVQVIRPSPLIGCRLMLATYSTFTLHLADEPFQGSQRREGVM